MYSDLVGLLKNLDEAKCKECEEDNKKIKYAIRGTKFLITYNSEDYLDKNKLSTCIQLLYPVKELYINFYLGVNRVAVWFEKQFSSDNENVFRFDYLALITPIVKNIKGKVRSEWINIIIGFLPSDKMTIHQIKEPIKRLSKKQLEQKLDKKQEKEHQKEMNNERKRTLNCERMQKYRKCLLAKKNKQDNQQQDNHQLKKEKQNQPESKHITLLINKQNELIKGLQELISKQQ